MELASSAAWEEIITVKTNGRKKRRQTALGSVQPDMELPIEDD